MDGNIAQMMLAILIDELGGKVDLDIPDLLERISEYEDRQITMTTENGKVILEVEDQTTK